MGNKIREFPEISIRFSYKNVKLEVFQQKPPHFFIIPEIQEIRSERIGPDF